MLRIIVIIWRGHGPLEEFSVTAKGLAAGWTLGERNCWAPWLEYWLIVLSLFIVVVEKEQLKKENQKETEKKVMIKCVIIETNRLVRCYQQSYLFPTDIRSAL
uniref:Uncharacterized protein n=1 Tax=Steinernema glaseri TaxID=37863 RepID=A0A1I7YRE7_9BILA